MDTAPQEAHANFLQRPGTPGQTTCPLCSAQIDTEPADTGVAHFSKMHPDELRRAAKGEDPRVAVERLLRTPSPQMERRKTASMQPGFRGRSEARRMDDPMGPSYQSSGRHSPTSSLKRQSSSTSPQPRRSRARQSDDILSDYSRGPSYNAISQRDISEAKPPPSLPLATHAPSSADTRHASASHGSHGSRQPLTHVTTGADHQDSYPDSDLVREPETRPISQEQLVAEVKGIYAGLVMVESKCIEVDNAQNAQKDNPPKLNNDQWQALIALHRTLLHEHHDFFLASQHPSASLALQRLASKYSMPARMWRHGIHSFLELLRHRLPASLEHMLTFIYLAYSMMALLYETVPAFEDTWIECLGDLGRYRMAIEDDSPPDREIWTGVSRHWYSRASDKAPTTGRLYHHLAILSRPNALQQLFYYVKSLCVPIPFLSARESITTLLDPVLSDGYHRLQAIDANFIKIHAILFTGRDFEKLERALHSFLSQLDGHIARTTIGWMEAGYCIGISNSCALLRYRNVDNILCIGPKPRHPDEIDHRMDGDIVSSEPDITFTNALDLNVRTHNVVLRRYGDPNTYPYLHVILAFMFHLAQVPAAMKQVEQRFPWKLLAIVLNTLVTSPESYIRLESPEFPGPAGPRETPRPLPEDYAMRGLIWTEHYYPDHWFSNDNKIDDEERYLEVASTTQERKDRCLWLGVRIARLGKWLQYDAESHTFSVPAEYEVELEDLPSSISDEAMLDAEAASRTPASVPQDPTWMAAQDDEDDPMKDRVPILIS